MKYKITSNFKIWDINWYLEIVDIKTEYKNIRYKWWPYIIRCNNCWKYLRWTYWFFTHKKHCWCLNIEIYNFSWYYHSMKSRCWKFKTYKSVTICKEWDNNKDLYIDFVKNIYFKWCDLDKDILSWLLWINPEYSPKTLIAIPERLNILEMFKRRWRTVNMQEYNYLLKKYLNRHLYKLWDKLDIETQKVIKEKLKTLVNRDLERQFK